MRAMRPEPAGDGFAWLSLPLSRTMMPSTVTALRLVCALLLGVSVSAQAPQTAQTPAKPAEGEFKDLPALMASLPKATVKPLDAASALLFTALPLACVDDLQPRPGATNRPYFWQ